MILLLAMAMAAAQGGDKAAAPTIEGAHFVVTDADGGDSETSNVPYRPETSCYSWVIEVSPEPRELRVREVFELPGSADSWGEDPTAFTAVNGDRSTAVTEFADSLEDGVISHGWCVAQGDPTGPHRIRVFAGDRLLHDFRFSVVAVAY